MFTVKETETGVAFCIHVLPRSSRCSIEGFQGDALKLRITAPPVEGMANKECIQFLAKKLGISKSRISITHGRRSKHKIVEIEGLKKKDIESVFFV
ncbi:MAG: DUF167 domain-containing protein [Syntrophales bacterium]